jgi:hypothetical protein
MTSKTLILLNPCQNLNRSPAFTDFRLHFDQACQFVPTVEATHEDRGERPAARLYSDPKLAKRRSPPSADGLALAESGTS